MPWDKKSDKSDTYVSVGAVNAYKVTIDDDDQYRYDRMWTKTFGSQVIHKYTSLITSILYRQMPCVGMLKQKHSM